MHSRITRRAALALPLALTLPRRAKAAPITFPDALGRTVTLPATAQRIVITFNFEEFTAIAGPSGWDRVVGFNRRQWAVNRTSNWERYQKGDPTVVDAARRRRRRERHV